MGAERDAVHELVSRAQEILAEDGRSATGAMLDRLAETLRAAAVDPEGKEELARGRVSREYERSGFDALGLFGAGAPGPRAVPQQDELAERRRRRQEAEKRVRDLRAQIRDAQREAATAEREAERAEREAGQARERADDLQSEVERLEEELEGAEEELKPRAR
jgi:hypothetical protein